MIFFLICILMRSSNQENKVQIIRFKCVVFGWRIRRFHEGPPLENFEIQFEGRWSHRNLSRFKLGSFKVLPICEFADFERTLFPTCFEV